MPAIAVFIAVLPADVLSYMCSFIALRPRILVVSRVCKRWRQVTFTTYTSLPTISVPPLIGGAKLVGFISFIKQCVCLEHFPRIPLGLAAELCKALPRSPLRRLIHCVLPSHPNPSRALSQVVAQWLPFQTQLTSLELTGVHSLDMYLFKTPVVLPFVTRIIGLSEDLPLTEHYCLPSVVSLSARVSFATSRFMRSCASRLTSLELWSDDGTFEPFLIALAGPNYLQLTHLALTVESNLWTITELRLLNDLTSRNFPSLCTIRLPLQSLELYERDDTASCGPLISKLVNFALNCGYLSPLLPYFSESLTELSLRGDVTPHLSALVTLRLRLRVLELRSFRHQFGPEDENLLFPSLTSLEVGYEPESLCVELCLAWHLPELRRLILRQVGYWQDRPVDILFPALFDPPALFPRLTYFAIAHDQYTQEYANKYRESLLPYLPKMAAANLETFEVRPSPIICSLTHPNVYFPAETRTNAWLHIVANPCPLLTEDFTTGPAENR